MDKLNRNKYDKELIRKLREQGLSFNEIAKEVGCTPQWAAVVCETEEQRQRRLEAQRRRHLKIYWKDRERKNRSKYAP